MATTRGRAIQVLVERIAPGERNRVPDRVIVEEPLEVRVDDHLVTTTMRTPGHDFELAVGLCHSEGLLDGAPVHEVKYCATGTAVDTEFNVVTVETGGRARVPVPRLTTTTAACGVCGSATLNELCARLKPRTDTVDADPAFLGAVVARARDAQPLFAQTGSVHAAAAFDLATGELSVVREDVGRHNAVDKVVGRLSLDGRIPADGLGLFVSGRASFEMVQKAWAGGFAIVVAVSGPSSLAVDTARAANITLVGFVRDGAMNVYAP